MENFEDMLNESMRPKVHKTLSGRNMSFPREILLKADPLIDDYAVLDAGGTSIAFKTRRNTVLKFTKCRYTYEFFKHWVPGLDHESRMWFAPMTEDLGVVYESEYVLYGFEQQALETGWNDRSFPADLDRILSYRWGYATALPNNLKNHAFTKALTSVDAFVTKKGRDRCTFDVVKGNIGTDQFGQIRVFDAVGDANFIRYGKDQSERHF